MKGFANFLPKDRNFYFFYFIILVKKNENFKPKKNCDGGHRLLGVGLYPLGGAQLLNQLLSVPKLALEAPDHWVQEVVPGVPAVPTVCPRTNIAQATISHETLPQVFPPPGRVPLISLKPHKVTLH